MSDSERLRFLVEVVEREEHHLSETDKRVFTHPFDAKRAGALTSNIDDAERVDAFVARFARLQDTVGDRLLPAVLRALAETVGAALDNLDRAEKLGWLSSADTWLAARKLRNRMVHEYVRDPALLAQALNEGHSLVPLLMNFSQTLRRVCHERQWI